MKRSIWRPARAWFEVVSRLQLRRRLGETALYYARVGFERAMDEWCDATTDLGGEG